MHFITPCENWNVDFLDSMSLSLQNNKVSTCRFSKNDRVYVGRVYGRVLYWFQEYEQ